MGLVTREGIKRRGKRFRERKEGRSGRAAAKPAWPAL